MKKQEKNTALELEAFVKEKGVQFGKFVSGWLTPKRLFWFLLVVYLLSLVPLLWIGFYNYPSADDYSIGSDCRQAFVNTHSLLATVWTGIVRAADDWLNWMGYFTSNFLMALPPQYLWGKGLCVDQCDHDRGTQPVYSVFTEGDLLQGISC